MSNPFVNNNILQNPVYCLACNCKYTEQQGDINGDDMEEYCRYLGFCDIKCWDKIPNDLQHDLTSYTYTNGCKVKSNHKFFCENIAGFSKTGKCKR